MTHSPTCTPNTEPWTLPPFDDIHASFQMKLLVTRRMHDIVGQAWATTRGMWSSCMNIPSTECHWAQHNLRPQSDTKSTPCISTTQIQVHMATQVKITMHKHIATSWRSPVTAYVDTAHWSSTTCALQVTYTQVALPEEMHSNRLVWPLSPLQSQMPIYTADWATLCAELFEKYFENMSPPELHVH